MHILKQKALRLVENTIGKKGRVLAIRAWEPATFFEVDVHFPHMEMHSWTRVQHIKVKVAEGVYRDYTPACWDASTHTCTLYIDAGKESAGSRWARSLSAGSEITYIGIASTQHKPVAGAQLICLGDMSCIGHYLALQQLAPQNSFTGAIAIPEEQHHEAFSHYFRWPLVSVQQTDPGGLEALGQWIKNKDLEKAAVYIAGHIPTCVQLKKIIKQLDQKPAGIQVQGFWS